MAQTFFNNTIIVRLRYKRSDIEFTKLDARTTMTDKIANFGGTFGIWAELTGVSLLGMINLLIISFKLLFRSRTVKRWAYNVRRVLITPALEDFGKCLPTVE